MLVYQGKFSWTDLLMDRTQNPEMCAHEERHRLTSFSSSGPRGGMAVNENSDAVCVENYRPHPQIRPCSLHLQSRSLFFCRWNYAERHEHNPNNGVIRFPRFDTMPRLEPISRCNSQH